MTALFPIVIHPNPACGTSRNVLAMIGASAFLLTLAACSPPPATTVAPEASTTATSTESLPAGALKMASPTEIRAAIERYGAHAVVRSLWGVETDQGWSRVEDGIGKGDAEWLAIVPLLDGGADGAAGEGVEIAVSDALQYNPSGVLRLLIETHRTPRLSCFFRRIEPTQEEVRAYYAAAIPAVEAVREEDLQAIKAQCLSELHSSEQVELSNANQ